MTAITQALSAALLHFVWQGLAVGLLLWVALFLMRKGPANARYAASCAALVILVLLPVLTACILYTPITAAGSVKAAPIASLAVRAERSQSSPGAWLAAIQAWALPLWSLGVLAFSLRLVFGSRQIAMLRRRGAPADAAIVAVVAGLGKRMGLARPVHVLITALADGPSVVGWLRPVILLPSATILGLTPEQLEAVLAHEIAHIRRYDYLVNILQIVAETLLFYHPAVWWASARIRHERELCCDDLAVRACGDALCYARALTTLEKLRVLTPNLAMGSTGGSLIYRIQRLVGETTRECGPSKLSGALTLLLGLTCFLLNVHWAQGQADATRTSDLAIAASSGQQVRDASGVEVQLGGGAAVLHREPVIYPKAAAERRIEGTVVVEVTLDARGEASDARVLSGPAELRKAALESVLNWHFMPGGAGTRQVSIVFHVPTEAEPSSARESEEAEQKVSGNQVFLYSRREVGNRREGILKREAELNELKAKILDLQQRQADVNVLQETQRKLADAAKGLENARRLNESPAGKSLKNILVLGLPDQAVKELQSRLPVHVGDTLTHESIEGIGRTVRTFDEHLEYIFMPAEDGPGVELVITTPDEGDWRVRRE